MPRARLDEIDRQILSDLQANGRMTNVELAQRAGISAPPCLRRVRSLENDGFIRGYHADLDAEKLGFEVIFFALIGLTVFRGERRGHQVAREVPPPRRLRQQLFGEGMVVARPHEVEPQRLHEAITNASRCGGGSGHGRQKLTKPHWCRGRLPQDRLSEAAGVVFCVVISR